MSFTEAPTIRFDFRKTRRSSRRTVSSTYLAGTVGISQTTTRRSVYSQFKVFRRHRSSPINRRTANKTSGPGNQIHTKNLWRNKQKIPSKLHFHALVSL